MNALKDKSNIALLVLSLICLAVLGCNGGLLDSVTPAKNSRLTSEYIGDPNSAGWTSLANLRDIRARSIVQHRDTQTELLRSIADDKAAYDDAAGMVAKNIEDAEFIQDVIVHGDGNMPGLISLLGAGFPALLAGRMMKRKGDKDENEVEAEVIKRGGTPKAPTGVV